MAQSKSNSKFSSYAQLMKFLYKYSQDNNVKTADDVLQIAQDNKNDIRSIIAKNSSYVNQAKEWIKKWHIDKTTDELPYINGRQLTKQDLENMFLLIKVIHFLNKHEKCKFEKKDGFWSVSDKNNNDNTKDFYFYCFAQEIEYFVGDLQKDTISVKIKPKEKRIDNIETGYMSVSSLCVDQDNSILTTHYRSDEPQCFNIGCNFIIDENKPLSHDNFAFGSNGEGRKCDIQNVCRFKNERKRNPKRHMGEFGNPNSVTENLSLGRRCGISDIETILSIRFHKQNNYVQHYLYNKPTISEDVDTRQMTNYDETILDTPEGKDEYKIHDFCFSFEPALFKTLQENEQKEMLKKMKDQISKVVDANKKLGVKQINIIDYENKPSFIKIPNDIKRVQEYLDTRIAGKNFDNAKIEQMNDDNEIVLLKDKLEYKSNESGVLTNTKDLQYNKHLDYN